MKQLIRDLMGDWQVWALFSLPALMVIVALAITTAINRNDTQRRLDAANAEVIKQVRAEVAALRAEVVRGNVERNQLKQVVEQVKEATGVDGSARP